MLTRLLLVLALLLTLPACQNLRTQTTAVTDRDSVRVLCLGFNPITYDGLLDTEETKDQIKAHNRSYRALCVPPAK